MNKFAEYINQNKINLPALANKLSKARWNVDRKNINEDSFGILLDSVMENGWSVIKRNYGRKLTGYNIEGNGFVSASIIAQALECKVKDITDDNQDNNKIKIPEFVSDTLDRMIADKVQWWDYEFAYSYVDGEDWENLSDWMIDQDNMNIMVAYLNPITRKFFEVV